MINGILSALRKTIVGQDSSVGIETPTWGEVFRIRPDWSWVLPSLLYNRYRVIPGGKDAGAWR